MLNLPTSVAFRAIWLIPAMFFMSVVLDPPVGGPRRASLGAAVGWLYLHRSATRAPQFSSHRSSTAGGAGGCAESSGPCSTRSGSRSGASGIAATTQPWATQSRSAIRRRDQKDYRATGHRMSWGRDRDHDEEPAQGLKALLRSFLPASPGRSAPSRAETRCSPRRRATSSRCTIRGVTRITGEDRDDIEVTAHRTARAESHEAAEALLGRSCSRSTTWLTSSDRGRGAGASGSRGAANLCIKLPRATELWVAAERARRRGGDPRDRARQVDQWLGEGQRRDRRRRDQHHHAKVSCSCTCGKLIARSSNGKIEIDQHRGSIDASTSNWLIRASLDDLGEEGFSCHEQRPHRARPARARRRRRRPPRRRRRDPQRPRAVPKGRETNGRVARSASAAS